MFLRNIPVQIAKGQTCKRGSLSSQRQLGLWGVRLRGAGPAWPSGQKGKREGVELHIQSLERILREQGRYALPADWLSSVLGLWAQAAGRCTLGVNSAGGGLLAVEMNQRHQALGQPCLQQKGVIQELLGRGSLLGFPYQHPLQEVSQHWGDL